MEYSETGVCLVLCTVVPEQSEEVIRHLVEQGFAACINQLPVRSSYVWEGEFCCDDEDLMIIKTSCDEVEALKNEILKLHSYDLPEIIVVPVTGGHQPYLEWVRKKVG